MADGLENYQTFTGENEEPTEDTYEVQTRKNKGGKYQTHFSGNKPNEAMFNYSARNVGPGYTKRMTLNGKTFKKTWGG